VIGVQSAALGMTVLSMAAHAVAFGIVGHHKSAISGQHAWGDIAAVAVRTSASSPWT
jgi:hypothetical protein